MEAELTRAQDPPSSGQPNQAPGDHKGNASDAVPASWVLPSVRSTGFVNALAFAVGAATAIVVARLLGATSRGEMVIASIGPILVGVLCTLGIEESIVFLTAQSRDDAKKHVIAFSGLAVAVAMGIVGSVVALALQLWYVGSRVEEVDRAALLLYATLPLLVAILQALLGVLRGQGRYVYWNVTRMTVPVTYLLVIVSLAFAGRVTVGAALVAHWLANLALAGYLVVALCANNRSSASVAVCRRLVRLGVGNHLITMQRLGNERLDQFVMARFVAPATLGNYAVAATYASVGLQLGLAVGFQLYSHVSASGRMPHRAFVSLCRRSFVLMTAIGTLGALAGWVVLPVLLGQEFRGAIVPAALLLAGGPPLTVGTLYASAWKASGEPLRAARAETVGLLTTGVLLACLLGPFGIMGAAATSVVAYSVVALVLIFGPPPTVVDQTRPA